MDRVYNFHPGPAALPLEVLEQGQREFVEYGKHGMSLLEMSHRSRAVERLNEETQELLKEVLGLPGDYHVLFMGGGASTQFALTAMNLLKDGKSGGYILSGSFSEKAYAEAQTLGEVKVLASSKEHGWRRLPKMENLTLEDHTAYVHMTTNNTIEGTQFRDIPNTERVPLIGDMTSDILSRRLDFTKFALFYAAAQKNLGPAGVTAVMIRDDLLKECKERIPSIFKYETYVRQKSLYNTPPVHSIYMMKLVLEWVVRQGGIAALEARNEHKATLLYDAIDAAGDFYEGLADPSARSRMNVTWRMKDEELEKRFVQEAERNGFHGLAGHRSVGGLRASIYNAVSLEACKALAEFMADFKQRNG